MYYKKACISIFVIFLFCTTAIIQANQQDSKELELPSYIVRVPYEYKNHLESLLLTDIATIIPEESIDIIISNDDIYLLENLQIPYDIIPELQYNPIVASSYHTFSEIEEELQNVSTQYPSITSLFSIGTSYENREIWCLEISDNPGVDESEPEVLFMGLHHAREWPTVEICLHIANNLTKGYDIDPTITSLIENRRIWIVPCVNPDGYYYDHDEYNGVKWWRKNRHFLPEFDEYGIDLNRNYGGSSNGNPCGMWGSHGMSHTASNDLYCGSHPFSELETQAIQRFVMNHSICAAISWHTYGELVMWPWGYTNGEQAPDNNYLSTVGQEIATRITNQDKNGYYTPKQASGLYPTTGDTIDWMYGYSHYVLGQPILCYTIEACTSFHPSQEVLPQVCQENYDGALYLLMEAENISDVSPRVLPPTITEITVKSSQEYMIHWKQNNPEANAEQYQLDTLTDFYLNTDDSSLSTECWDLTGFIVDTSTGHSLSNSYYSQNRNVIVSSMTSKYPIPIKAGMNLSFWCQYNIKPNQDNAFVEISTDGRYYRVLDSFSGTNNEFTYKEYALQEFEGQSLYIRFRYISDSTYGKYGFYVDDIYPVALFNTIITESDQINGLEYTIIHSDDIVCYHRVRGYNQAFGWGDFSSIHAYNNSPSPPQITGPSSGTFNESYTYVLQTVDPEQDKVYYYVDWGDGQTTDWIGPYDADDPIAINHSWDESGRYTIKAQAKDIYGKISGWSTIQVNMPKSRMLFSIQTLIERFLAHHPSFSFLFSVI